MKLAQLNIEKLHEIQELLAWIPEHLYTGPQEILQGATIGQHIRHIIEFYVCLQKGESTGIVCYDDRERDRSVETSMETARLRIEQMCFFLDKIIPDGPLAVRANYEANDGSNEMICTSVGRELAYALDHSIHHLAIVNIALQQAGEHPAKFKHLGMAPSTKRYKDHVYRKLYTTH